MPNPDEQAHTALAAAALDPEIEKAIRGDYSHDEAVAGIEGPGIPAPGAFKMEEEGAPSRTDDARADRQVSETKAICDAVALLKNNGYVVVPAHRVKTATSTQHLSKKIYEDYGKAALDRVFADILRELGAFVTTAALSKREEVEHSKFGPATKITAELTVITPEEPTL